MPALCLRDRAFAAGLRNAGTRGLYSGHVRVDARQQLFRRGTLRRLIRVLPCSSFTPAFLLVVVARIFRFEKNFSPRRPSPEGRGTRHGKLVWLASYPGFQETNEEDRKCPLLWATARREGPGERGERSAAETGGWPVVRVHWPLPTGFTLTI